MERRELESLECEFLFSVHRLNGDYGSCFSGEIDNQSFRPPFSLGFVKRGLKFRLLGATLLINIPKVVKGNVRYAGI